jgi:hypothetical protein
LFTEPNLFEFVFWGGRDYVEETFESEGGGHIREGFVPAIYKKEL